MRCKTKQREDSRSVHPFGVDPWVSSHDGGRKFAASSSSFASEDFEVGQVSNLPSISDRKLETCATSLAKLGLEDK